MTTPTALCAPASDVALVLETHNLAAVSPIAAQAAMERLLSHLGLQTLPLESLREVVVTHDGLDDEAQLRLQAAAGREIDFVRLPEAASYYDAKNLGFDATTAPLVAFGDADCWPDRDWLRQLVAPLALGWEVSAGRTTYPESTLGTALSSVDFLYLRCPGGTATRNFFANNVAFRRPVFEQHRYASAATYRGACQVLSMQLRDAGIPIRYAVHAHTVHQLPAGWRELVEQRLRRGRDLRQLSPRVFDATVPLPRGRRTPLPAGRRLAGLVMAGRWAYSLRYVGRQRRSIPTRLAQTAVMTTITGLDTVGAMRGHRRRRRRDVEIVGFP